MQPNTGHLVDLGQLKAKLTGDMEREGVHDLRERANPIKGELGALEDAGYVEVPGHLEHAARRKLAGRPEIYVSLTSGGRLSRYAAQLRAEASNRVRTRKAQNKAARQSRKRNRRS